ncbi:MAG: hypothetical protein NZ901_06025 [Geminocystis sp.]|nr:hypothetical protein [Geminocystis sp.]HIK38390.1 hypothetical protein [Geminocystis sp. M7585_C2015_104]MCS7147735.1 hypothetical protein [Geminocystis sp.]MCX8079245.1 hypothetical protein [Geminocystis sp.]MDW8116691.1 hypothetical protein [Geminocystis sp.]
MVSSVDNNSISSPINSSYSRFEVAFMAPPAGGFPFFHYLSSPILTCPLSISYSSFWQDESLPYQPTTDHVISPPTPIWRK